MRSALRQAELFKKPNSEINLHEYNVIIINSSGGKDSSVAIFEICRLAEEQNYPKSNIHVSHQDLGKMEWKGTIELVKEQVDYFGLPLIVTKRKDKNGREETLLEYIERRGMFPSNKQRYCTSDFKRAPGARVITKLAPGREKSKVLYVFGFRAEESPARKKKVALELNERYTTKSGREVWNYLPVHDWSVERVWGTIRDFNIPYHNAYDLGMPRLSCCFCIFSPFDALVTAGKANPELLDEYVAVEKKINHSFTHKFGLSDVKEAILRGYEPKKINDWVM